MYLRIKRASMALCLSLFCFGAYAQKTVTGVVKDATGEPVIGATIMANGKPVATTDFDGNFSVPNAEPSTVIKITYVGFKDQQITIGNKSTLNVSLAEDNQNLNEVVVVGYGTMKKSDLTGSISSMHSDDIVAKGSASVLGAMQGAVAGVNITQSTGRANGGMSIEIRGKSSIYSSTTPLFVVDGVICDNIDFLNEQDIEKIDILKDASSTAIYGSRASAGVVIVTTKGGTTMAKGAKPTISYDGYYGVAVVSRMPEFQDAQEFYNWRFAKFLTYAGGVATATNGQPVYQIQQASYNQMALQVVQNDYTSESLLKKLLANGTNVNWPGMVTQNGRQQNHYLSVSGSTKDVSYQVGVGYHELEGVYAGDKESKTNFKGALDAKISKVISAGFNMNIARSIHDYTSDDGVKEAYRMNPFMQAYDSDGNIIQKPGINTVLGTNGNQFTSSYNPLLLFENEDKQQENWHLLGNIYINLNPLEGLNFKTTFSPTYTYYRTGQYDGTLVGATTNSASKTTQRSFGWTWDNILSYDKTFNKIHHINLTGVVSMEGGNSEKEILAYTSVLEGTKWYNLASGTYDAVNSKNSYTEYGMLSYVARANYTLKDRYMVTGTLRMDGSSKFKKGHRWGTFPSVAFAWRASEEDFVKNNFKWISNLKLRLSYGLSGNNSGIDDYAYMVNVDGPNYYPFGSSYATNAMYPSGIVDENLHWEKSHEFNAGLDFGFLDGRISGTFDWYHKKSIELLGNIALPLETGVSTLQTNIGSVLNQGVELSLTGILVKNKDLNISLTGNIAHNHNEVKQINGSSDYQYSKSIYTGSFFVGSPVNNVYSYIWDGIVSDKNMTVPNNAIAKAKGFTPGATVKQSDYYYACYGWTEGNPIVKDVNGDGSITASDKKVYSSDPDWTGSLTLNAAYKGFDFAATVYTKQNYYVYSNFLQTYTDMSDRGRQRLNMDCYIPAGTLIDCDGVNSDGTYINPVYQQTTHYGSYPMANYAGTSGGTNNSYWGGEGGPANIVDASYTKIKNITLGYTFPTTWINKIGCQKLRLYCTVTNPFVFSDYKGFDPEWADASLKNDGPSTTTWQFGANIKF